ncbi:MAG TPA: translocation/assembly module TamB domain-containing protein [Polyangiaceae bacterium]|jgi:autotransporter translocation and assembly factor TamB|nr:translocation/assembly module TamB domain-containing protein [Polyangiaceae bacterium]
MEHPRLSKHWAAHALAWIALLAVFVGSVALGVALHADLPVSRRLAGRLVENALGGVLAGRVVVSPLDVVSFTHVAVAKATLLDTYGHPVLEVQKVRADMSLGTLLRDLVFGPTTGGIVVSHVQVQRAVVTLRADPKTGEPTLVRAVSPVTSSPGGKTTASGPDVLLPSIELGEAIVRSQLPALPRFEARLRSVHGQVRGGPDGVAVDVERFGLSVRGATVPAHGTGTFALRAPGPLHSTFDGFLGDVEVRAAATLDGSHLDVTADAPRIKPAAARALARDWPLTETATAHAEVRGDLPNLTAKARATAGKGALSMEGPLTVGATAHAVLALKGEHLDARGFAAGAPVTDVSFDGTVDLRTEGDALVVDATVHTLPSTVEGSAIPAVDAHATLAGGTMKGTLDIHEPGLPIKASFDVSPALAVDVNAETTDVALAGITRLGLRGVHGHGRARLHAHLEGQTLKATVDGDLGGIATNGVELGRAHVHADVTGPLNAPGRLRGTARIEGTSARLSGFDLDSVTLDARGTPAGLDFNASLARTAGPALKATGLARLTPRPLLEKTRVVIDQGPVHVEGDVASLDFEEGRAEIRNVRVAGAGGTITGNLRLAPNLLEVSAEGEGVDLDALSRAMGVPRGEASGTLRLSTDLVVGRDVTRGHVAIGLGNATIGLVGGLSLQVSADLDDRHLTGGASGLVAGIGTFGTTFDTMLDGSPLEVAAWRKITGSGEVQVSDVRLNLLTAILPKDSPLESIAGRAYGRVLLERKTATTLLPSAYGTFSTQELALSLRGSNGAKSVHVAGIDLTATGQLDATTGEITGTTLAADAHGDLITATGALKVDVPRLVSEPARALAQLVDTPVEVVMTVPARKLADLPAPFGDAALAGTMSAIASLRGTFAHPTLYVTAQGHDLARAGNEGHPFDAHGDAQYEWTTRAVAAKVTAAVTGRDVGRVTVHGTVPGGLDTFRGTAQLSLDKTPLDVLGVSGDRALGGNLVGVASLTRNDQGGSVDADVRVMDASIEHTALGDGHLQVATSGELVTATLGFSGARGTLDATGSAPVVWQSPLPGLGASAPVKAHLALHDFAAVALSPATTSVLSRLGGRLDADLGLVLTPSTGPDGPTFSGGVDGTATLKEGSVLIDALGLQVNDLTASAVAHGVGATTTIAIRDVVGKVRSSKANLRGTAELTMEGVRVTHGTAELDADDMPILFKGAPQGRITGRAEAKLTREPGRMQVDIELPTLTLALPQASTRQVQDLADNPDVSILQFERTGPPEPVAMTWRLALHLGNAVNLRRADVELRLTGTPILDLGETAVASGSIDLVSGGRIPVLGKVFSVEDGKVVFDTDDPANPHVDLHASTHAGNDSIVYVEVTGTMRDAKIALRSDPPLPEAEVFALLLGGSSDTDSTAVGTQSNAAGAGAVAIGSGVAMGVNQLVANSPVEVRVGTTEQNQPRYTAAVRIRENLYFEASEYQQADYGSTSSTDRSVYSGTVDYRFTRRWSLKTEVGTAGGALDLLWQYRY